MKLIRRSDRPDPELIALQEELRRAHGELAAAYRQFDQAIDPDLIECCIFRINAAKSRCNYLTRTIKGRTAKAAAAMKGDILWI